MAVEKELRILGTISQGQIDNVWKFDPSSEESKRVDALRQLLGSEFLKEVHTAPLNPSKTVRLDAALLQVARAETKVGTEVQDRDSLHDIVSPTLDSLHIQDASIRKGLMGGVLDQKISSMQAGR